MKSKLRLLAASLLTALCCGTASAQLDNFSAEGIVGISSFKVATGKFTNNAFTQTTPVAVSGVLPAPNSVTITSKDKSSMAYGLRVGYQLSELFSVEGTYLNVGTAKVSGTANLLTPNISASAVTFSTDLDVTSWSFGFAAHHTMDKFTFVARFAISTSDAEWGKNIVTATIPPNNSAQSAGKILQDAFPAQQRKVDFNYGVGGSFKLNDHMSLNGNYDYISGNQAASVISASFKYSF